MARRRKQKQRILIIKLILLIIFIGGFAGLFAYTWIHMGGTGEKEKEPDGPLVCVDPGHGGEDSGAIGPDGRREEDDNLKLALAVRDALAKKNIRTVMTREKDEKVSLQGRCDIANESGALLFVSVHRNSAADDSAGGVEIWTANRGKGARMAGYILEGLKKAGIQKDRGIQSGTSSGEDKDYYVNRHTKMPSCLVEMGFITNEEDNRLLDKNLDSYADAIAEGVEKMLQEIGTEDAV